MNGQNREIDTTKIISFLDKIIIKSNIETRDVGFQLDNGTDKLQLSTNNRYRLFLSLDYDFIGFTVGFSPEFIPDNNDDDLRGKSSFTEYQFRFFLGNWVQKLRYTNVEGFYVQNTSDFISGWMENRDPFLQLPNLSSTFWGGSTSYVFNPDFSFRNIVYNTEWQLKSAGSFVPSLRYGYTTIKSPNNATTISENDIDIRIAPEYYYTWVIKKNWFIAPYFTPSIGVRFSTEKENKLVTERNTYFPIGLGGGLQVGYSSEKIIFGFTTEFDSSFYDDSTRTHITNNQLYAKLYFGIRLEAPDFVKKLF